MSRWRLEQHWAALRQRRRAHAVFVRPGEVWSYAPDGPPAASHHADLAAWCEGHPQAQAHLVLSGLATHDLVVQDAALPLHDTAAVAAWAAHQMLHYHGSAAQHWPVAPWQAAGRSGATFIHGVDLAALQRTASAQAVRLRAVRPWWPLALAAAARQGAEPPRHLLLVEGTLLTQVRCHRGAVLDVQQRWLEQPTLAALASLLSELQAELQPPVGAPQAALLLGYGLADASPAVLRTLPVRVLGSLAGACPEPGWVVP